MSTGDERELQPGAALSPAPAGANRRGRLTREDWVEIGLGLVAAGRTPISVPELCRATGTTKGSLYAHFDGIDDLEQAIVSRWCESLRLDQLAGDIEALHSSADRIRLLVQRALPAGWAPGAISRWSAVSPAAALALTSARRAYTQLAAGALEGLGLSGEDARLAASLLIRAVLSSDSPAADTRREAELLICLAGRTGSGPT